VSSDPSLLARLRNIRKRRGEFRSTETTSNELARLRSLLPRDSVEREVFDLAEIGGLSYKTIAAKLNFSERHVYRVRARMVEMIDEGEVAIASRQSVNRTTGLAMPRVLFKYGRFNDALAHIRRLERSGLSSEMRIGLLALEAMIACRLGCGTNGAALLATAQQLIDTLPQEDQPGAKRRVAYAAAFADYCEGLYESTIDRCELAVRPFLAQSGDDDVARDLIFLGIVHQEGGSPERAVEVLTAAEHILKRRPAPSFADLADVYVHRSFALGSLPDRLDDAQRDAARAMEIADTHGLPCEYVWGRLASGVLNELTGRPSEALADVQEALDLGRSLLSGDALARTHFISSRVEICAQKFDGTLDHLAEAKELLHHDSFLGDTILPLVEARVHRASGNYRSTIVAATRAIDGFARRQTSTHYFGEAYLARAIAGHALGVDVRDDAEAAVTLLRRGGWVNDQARALEFAARVLH